MVCVCVLYKVIRLFVQAEIMEHAERALHLSRQLAIYI